MISEMSIFNYLDSNCDKEKESLILKIMLIFKLTKERAIKLYYLWKKHFMNSDECVPIKSVFEFKKEEKILIKGNIAIGKYGTYTLYEGCICVNGHYYNNEQEIERNRYYRFMNRLPVNDDMMDEAIQVIRLKEIIEFY